jgi:hypothetical protein
MVETKGSACIETMDEAKKERDEKEPRTMQRGLDG